MLHSYNHCLSLDLKPTLSLLILRTQSPKSRNTLSFAQSFPASKQQTGASSRSAISRRFACRFLLDYPIMDKSWINEDRAGITYEEGVARFLDFAFDKVSVSGRITCPCAECMNIKFYSREVVNEHLTVKGFDRGYARSIWALHGELSLINNRNETMDEDEPVEVDDMHGMLDGAFGISNYDGRESVNRMAAATEEERASRIEAEERLKHMEERMQRSDDRAMAFERMLQQQARQLQQFQQDFESLGHHIDLGMPEGLDETDPDETQPGDATSL